MYRITKLVVQEKAGIILFLQVPMNKIFTCTLSYEFGVRIRVFISPYETVQNGELILMGKFFTIINGAGHERRIPS